MTVSDDKAGEELAASFDDLWDESLAATERQRQEAIGNLRQLAAARPLHYHFSHDVMPAYFADPTNLGVVRQSMEDQESAEKLVEQLYHKTLQAFPGCERCFGPAEISCSRHSIKSNWPERPDIPLLVFTMPQPKAEKESFLACLGLLPRQEFYHNTEWRYFVVDGSARPGQTPATFLWEYLVDGSQPGKGGFLLMNSCWPQIDALLEQLAYQWDERFYTL